VDWRRNEDYSRMREIKWTGEGILEKKYWKIYYCGHNSQFTLGTGLVGTKQVNSLLLDIED
jgi:hypothetical protein